MSNDKNKIIIRRSKQERVKEEQATKQLKERSQLVVIASWVTDRIKGTGVEVS